MKRSTLAIFDSWVSAELITKLLKRQGFDVKRVSKHAVQVAPNEENEALEFLRNTKLPKVWEKK